MNTIKVFSASLSNVGRKRNNNEDSLNYCEPEDPQERLQSGNLYIVADGVGGAAKGERASRYAAEKVLYDYYQMPQEPPGERLRQLIREAGNQIYQYADGESFGRMATTMVAAVVRDGSLVVAHVGDSRAYLMRGGKVVQLTRDHSLVGEMIRDGSLTEEESLSSKVKNRLTRSLGGEEDVPVDVTAEIPLAPGDRILLCTDGLTRYALPADLLAMVPGRSPAQAVQALIDFANSKGGADNVTAIVISVHDQDEKVDWTAAAIHIAPAPLPWEQETDPNAGTVYPKAPLQSRRPWREAFPGWMPPSLVVFAVIVVLGIIAMGLNARGGANPAAMAITSTQTAPQSELTATPTLPMPTETPTQMVTPTFTPQPAVGGKCEYTVVKGDNFWTYEHNWGIAEADVSCKTVGNAYYCQNGKLMHGLQPGVILIFMNIKSDFCTNTIGGTPIP
ncbi:MAG: PP2C family serine/threonine-protein phosphatase [Anaerolineales bacterium]